MESLMIGHARRSNLAIILAKSTEDIREAQRLRYRIFRSTSDAQLPTRFSGIDEDVFDPYCSHLLIRDTERDIVVGTHRLLTSWQAKEAGQFYSETAFDLINLKSLVPRLIEVGRSCIHPDYCPRDIIALLRAGLAQYMMTGGYEYLMVCASISLAEGDRLAIETYLTLRNICLSPDHWRVVPHRPYPINARRFVSKPLPPLVREYVHLGAYLCGEPAWNEHFNTADFLMLLPLSGMNPRFVRHFTETPCHNHTQAASQR